jgi:hypothetical protein
MGYRLYESAGVNGSRNLISCRALISIQLPPTAGDLGLHPAFADSPDFDTLRLWAVTHNDWKAPEWPR